MKAILMSVLGLLFSGSLAIATELKLVLKSDSLNYDNRTEFCDFIDHHEQSSALKSGLMKHYQQACVEKDRSWANDYLAIEEARSLAWSAAQSAKSQRVAQAFVDLGNQLYFALRTLFKEKLELFSTNEAQYHRADLVASHQVARKSLDTILDEMIVSRDLFYELTKKRVLDCNIYGTDCYTASRQDVIYEAFLGLGGKIYFLLQDILNYKLDRSMELPSFEAHLRNLARQNRNLTHAIEYPNPTAALIAVRNIDFITNQIWSDIKQ